MKWKKTLLQKHPDIEIVSAEALPEEKSGTKYLGERDKWIKTEKYLQEDPLTWEFWETKIRRYGYTASIGVPAGIVRYLNLSDKDKIFVAIKKGGGDKMEEEQIKYSVIGAEELPKSLKRFYTIWDKLFASISKGKAIVIPESEAKPQSVTSALRIRQRRGKFLHLVACTRSDDQRNHFAYVIYPNDGVEAYKRRHRIKSAISK